MLDIFFVLLFQFLCVVLSCDGGCGGQARCVNLGQYLVPIHRYCCFCNGDPRINHVYTVNQDNSYFRCKTEATSWPGSPGAILRSDQQNIATTYCSRLIRVVSFNNISTTDLILAFGETEIAAYSHNTSYQQLEILGYCAPESGYCGAYVPIQSIVGTTPTGRHDHFYTNNDYEKEQANVENPWYRGAYEGIKCYLWDNIQTRVCPPMVATNTTLATTTTTTSAVNASVSTTRATNSATSTSNMNMTTTTRSSSVTSCPSGSYPVFIALGINISSVGNSFVESFSCQNGEIVCLRAKSNTWTIQNGVISGDYTVDCRYPCIVDGQGRSWYPNSPWLFDSYYLRASCDRGACATYIFQDNSKRTCSIPVGYGLTNGTATRSYLSQFSDCVSPIVNPIDSTYSACGYINVRSISCHLFPCTKPIGCPFAV